MADNRYFIGLYPKSDNSKIMEVIFNGGDGVRYNNKKTKMAVKLPLGDKTNHNCLKSFKEYTNKGILEELKKEEWQTDNNF